MVVYIHSLGSVWQRRERTAGISIWNTTGVDDRRGIRPRSVVYGQLAFGRLAKIALSKSGDIRRSKWTATDLSVTERGRSVRLVAPAARDSAPDRYIVTVNEQLAGALDLDGFEPEQAQIISLSRWRDHSEAMLLVKPYGWIKGDRGSATLVPSGAGCEWKVKPWA
jgi:hypothetical protein